MEQHTPLEQEFFNQLGESLRQLEARSIELERRLASVNELENKLTALEAALNKQPQHNQEKEADLLQIGEACLPISSILGWSEFWYANSQGRVNFYTPMGHRLWTDSLNKEQFDELTGLLRKNLGNKVHKYKRWDRSKDKDKDKDDNCLI